MREFMPPEDKIGESERYGAWARLAARLGMSPQGVQLQKRSGIMPYTMARWMSKLDPDGPHDGVKERAKFKQISVEVFDNSPERLQATKRDYEVAGHPVRVVNYTVNVYGISHDVKVLMIAAKPQG